MSVQKTISQEGLVDNKMRDYYEEQLTKLHTQMIAMGSLCEKAIADATKALTDGDIALAKEVMDGDAKINQQERDIEAMCIKLLLHQQPVAGDLRRVSAALKMVTDMERVGDQAADIAEIVVQMNEKLPDQFLHICKMGTDVYKRQVYILCSTGVYLIAIYVLTGTYIKRVLGMTRREGMPGCKADTLVTWGVTTICLQGVILVLTVPSVDKDTHASSGLITAFSVSSSIGVRLVHLIPASLKLP